MSWDTATRTETCPCGKGTYTVLERSNDWGQYRTSWSMNCEVCSARYALHSFIYYPQGLHSEGHAWVLKGPYKEARKLRRQADALKRQALSIARKKHLGRLVARFEGVSRKDIWAAISEAVPYYKSLGTFYLHTKGKNPEQFLADLFSEHELKSVWKLLGTRDAQIAKMQKVAEALRSKAQALISKHSAR